MQLSIVLICYNQKEYIAQSIESVLTQKIECDYEFIIGDDCSSDGTSEIIQHYAHLHSNIVFLKNEKNLGLMPNFMNCLRVAKGKYIATIDGDDLWLDKSKLQQQISFLEANSAYGMVHTQFDQLYCYPKFLSRRYVKSALGKKSAQDYSLEGIMSGNYICSSTVCFRKDLVMNESDFVNRMSNGFFHVEDTPIYIHIAMKYKIGYIEKSTALYRIHKNSLSRFTSSSKRIAFIEQSYQLKLYFLSLLNPNARLKDKIKRNHNLNLAYHYYKDENLKLFREVYSQIDNKPINIRTMAVVLWLKKIGLIRILGAFKV